jgi:hypothetical protein
VRVRVPAIWLVALLAALAPQVAAAQEGTPSPSPRELWETYPLDPTPQPAVPAPTPVAQEAAGPGGPVPGGAEDGGASGGMLVFLAALSVGGGLALLLLRRASRPRPRATLVAPARGVPGVPHAASLLRVSGAAPSPPGRAVRGPQALAARKRKEGHAGGGTSGRKPPAAAMGAAGGAPNGGSGPSRRAAALPPDPARGWIAEIEWEHSAGESAFRIVARDEEGGEPVALAKSPPLEWPPAGPESVQAMTQAAEGLEAWLVAAGWKALQQGDTWYAKRLAWEPAQDTDEPSDPPAEAEPPHPSDGDQAPAERPAGSGRFVSRQGWPKGTESLWRCEIRWAAGYASSRFEAIVYRPGAKRGRSSGRSAPFRWTLMNEPDPQGPEYRARLQSLAAALEAAGWERLGKGAHWYSERFLWRKDGTPPRPVQPLPAEAGRGR